MNDGFCKRLRHGRRVVDVYYDDDPPHPWKDHDHFGTFWAWNRRYTIGDEPEVDPGDFAGWEEMEAHIETELGAVLIVPVYMFDHSGISISTGAYGDRWDSGRLGLVWVTAEDVKKQFGVEEITDEDLKQARKIIDAEIETYSQFLGGYVYGFRAYDIPEEIDLDDAYAVSGYIKKNDEVHSCWGFFGYNHRDSGLFDEAFDDLPKEVDPSELRRVA